MNKLKASFYVLILSLNIMLVSCGGSSSSGDTTASAALSANAEIAGVWWAVDAAPAYALQIQQNGNQLQLGDESAVVLGNSITMTSLNGEGSVSSDGNHLALTWHFPGYGTVHTNYQRVEDVLQTGSQVTIPHHESLALHGSLAVREFSLLNNEQVYVETSGPVGGDTWMFLFDQQMNLIGEADDPGIDFYATLDESLSPGQYYVVVTEWGNSLVCDLDITLGAGG